MSADDPKIHTIDANVGGDESALPLSDHIEQALGSFYTDDGYQCADRNNGGAEDQKMIVRRREDMVVRLIGVLAARELLIPDDLNEIIGHPYRQITSVEVNEPDMPSPGRR